MAGTETDQGRYEERTVLAWHRTALSIAGGAVVQFRLTYADAPAWVLALIAVAALLSIVAVVESRHRYPGSTTSRAAVVDRGGRLALLLATSVTLLLSVELGLVFTRR